MRRAEPAKSVRAAPAGRRYGPSKMGRLERATYEHECRRWSALRARSKDAPVASCPENSGDAPRGFGARRWRTDHEEAPGTKAEVFASDAVAAVLMLARAVDGVDGLEAAIRDGAGAPVIAVDVQDELALSHLERSWKEVVLRDAPVPSAAVDSSLRDRDRAEVGCLHLFVLEPPTALNRDKRRQAALTAISFARPLLAFSPMSATYLPDAIVRSCDEKVVVGPPDAELVAATIRIVTGEWPRGVPEPARLERIGTAEIAIAVRFDRSATECMDRLGRLASEGLAKADSRELRLDELFGMDAAVEYARSLVRDVVAWRCSALPWSALDAGVCFEGPAGTGKTTICRVIAAEAGMDILVTSAARWQSSGDGHLGHYLRAMRRDYEEACRRAAHNAVLFVIEECDSIVDRNSVRHDHRDYVVQCVNAVLEMMDSLPDGRGVAGRVGAAERPRIVFVGTSNDAARCDPALLRAGRLNRVIRVGLPDHEALEKIFRLRLRGDLADADLRDLALAATGCSGADVERIVKDARRAARHGGRDVALDDLKLALASGAEIPPALRPRIAVHEAGHILVDVLLDGPRGAVATMTAGKEMAAGSFRLDADARARTFADHFNELQVLLAGRAAEVMTYSDASDGWAGAFGSDLQRATDIAAAMIGSYGLAGPPPLFLGPTNAASAMLRFPEVREAARQLLVRAHAACERLIGDNRNALDAVAARLLADGRIEGDEVARIVARHRKSPAKRTMTKQAIPDTTEKGAEA